MAVYRAEHLMAERGLTGLAFADGDAASNWLTPIAHELGACRQFVGSEPRMQVIVTDDIEVYGGGAQTVAMTTWAGSIVVREGGLNQLNLLHEVAHLVLQNRGITGHGAEFVDLAQTLYREHISPEAARQFRAAVEPFLDLRPAATNQPSRQVQGPSFGGLA